MAHIFNMSNSTQYLINGMRLIKGKKLTTLDEIQYFYDNYDKILAETQSIISRQHDEIIIGLGNDELRLNRQLQDTIAQLTIEVDKNIDDMNRMSILEKRFFTRISYRLRHWLAVGLRNHHIHAPCTGITNELHTVSDRKNHHINNKQSAIQKEFTNIKSSYDFLKANETYLIGSQGEETVIKALFYLSNEYYVLNDVNLRFHPSLFWNKTGEYIKTCQIDHIVIGPTGIFVLETKNWTPSFIEKNLDLLRWQVNRSDFALKSFILDNYSSFLDRPDIFYILVSVRDKKPEWKLDRFIDVVSPNLLCDFILRMKPTLTEDTMKKFIKIVTNPLYQRPRF
jgi:hypothetical protein